jgi:hypothetical protein
MTRRTPPPPKDRRRCPMCGQPLAPELKPQRRFLVDGVALALMIIGVVAIIRWVAVRWIL